MKAVWSGGFWVYFRGRVTRFAFKAGGKERSQGGPEQLEDLLITNCDEGDWEAQVLRARGRALLSF